jgi:hypothetical protein
MDKWEKRELKVNKRRKLKKMNSVHKNKPDEKKENSSKYRRELAKLMKALEQDG